MDGAWHHMLDVWYSPHLGHILVVFFWGLGRSSPCVEESWGLSLLLPGWLAVCGSPGGTQGLGVVLLLTQLFHVACWPL